jgi:ribonuclease P/MRP protein subunit RPP40
MLFPSQYGFRKGHSTQHAVSECTTFCIKACERNEYVASIFLDLSKAFDTIDHQMLLSKLEQYGIRGVALEWFRSYITGRKQYVMFNNVSSIPKSITHGVPQGYVLGPLLFILYTNDIPQAITKFNLILFADDTTMYLSGKKPKQLILISKSRS